jgi:hypothetical protein
MEISALLFAQGLSYLSHRVGVAVVGDNSRSAAVRLVGADGLGNVRGGSRLVVVVVVTGSSTGNEGSSSSDGEAHFD